MGCGGAAAADVGAVERRLPRRAGSGGAHAGERAARRAQPLGPPAGLQLRGHPPRPRHRGAAAAGRVRRSRGTADRADAPRGAARAVRRKAPRGRAPAAAHRDGGGATGRPRAVARGGDAASGRGERPLHPRRVRGRPRAGGAGRGGAGVSGSGRVLPPHLHDRRPARAPAPGGAAPHWGVGRSGGGAPDHLRRRQDPLHARRLAPRRPLESPGAAGRGGGAARRRRERRRLAAGPARRLRGHRVFPGRDPRGQRHRSAHRVGRPRRPAARGRGLPAGAVFRPLGYLAGLRSAEGAPTDGGALRDPDRRVGGHAAPAR